MMMSPKYRCLLLVRISTTKQLQESDSPEHQIRRGLACAEKRFGYAQDEVLILTEAWSGRKEDRPMLDQALDLVEKYSIERLFVYDIDRLTRAGASQYELIKRRFKALGCDMSDVKGIIQPESNTLEGTGGAFGGDFTYDWSVFAASEKAEVMEAQMAKDEARKILSRTIPVQIFNAQKGRTNRRANFGFRNTKIVDESGKPQASKEIDESEAWYVRKIFEGVAVSRDVRNLCDELNGAGFRTRKLKKWNADRSKIVGHIGGQPLTPRRVSEIVERPIYAGYVVEKWTHWRPVLANHGAIVSLKLWNAANEGRWRIQKDADSPTGWIRLDLEKTRDRRSCRRQREDFPFKNYMHCDTCGKPLKAAYSRSRSGIRYGYYFCNRKHKQVGMQQGALHEMMRQYLGDIRFTPEIADRFEVHLRKVWAERVGGLNRHLADANAELAALRQEADALFEKIKLASNPLIIARLEAEYEIHHQRIKLLEAKRDEKEFSEADMNRTIKWGRHMVEHLDELIIDAQDEGLRGVFWSLIFMGAPALKDLQDRTAELSPLVRLKDELRATNSGLVCCNVIRSNQIWEELCRWEDQLSLVESKLPAGFEQKASGHLDILPKAA